MPKNSKMTINFELLKVSKLTSLKICISLVMEKVEIQKIWTSGKPHSKGSIGYSASVISLPHNHVTNLHISSGATGIKFGQ